VHGRRVSAALARSWLRNIGLTVEPEGLNSLASARAIP